MLVNPTALAVMLIDDNRIDNILNKKVLEKEKIAEHILVFDQAIKALEYLKEAERTTDSKPELIPALIFIDVVMPEMNGFQFIREFDKLTIRLKSRIKVVFISSSMLNQEQQNELNTYDVSVLVVGKPLTKSILDELRQKYL